VRFEVLVPGNTISGFFLLKGYGTGTTVALLTAHGSCTPDSRVRVPGTSSTELHRVQYSVLQVQVQEPSLRCSECVNQIPVPVLEKDHLWRTK
jgi:hypothetical protein